MTNNSLRDFNRHRQKEHLKDEKQEDYLLGVNKVLQNKEVSEYLDLKEENPTLFVVGLPRSGTTFMTQLLAQSLELGYVNNFIARFWLAPVTGINLSKIILGSKPELSFESKYASTKPLMDIHEFGYFWRKWLLKDNISSIINSAKNEKIIDWVELKKCILNIHQAFGSGWVCKNIYGGYHMRKFSELLKKSFFIYIERDPLDVAISILDARNGFYSNPNLWWSTVPLEYHKLKDLPVKEQIAGQVFYLRKYYNEQLQSIPSNRVVYVNYKEIASNPKEELDKIKQRINSHLNEDLISRHFDPMKIRFKSYHDRSSEKQEFSSIIRSFS